MLIQKLLLLHFIADFVLQPREMGKKKSEEPRWLAGHLAIQFTVFAPFTSIWFALANCTIHGVIDWFIWRGYKYSVISRLGITHMNMNAPNIAELKNSWKYWEDHLFYTTIGFDQLLHALTLVTLAGYML
jgi:hypothetical protein